MADFPVAADCWTEVVVTREGVDLGSKNGSSVEEEDGQGGLQAGEKEGRGSRVEGARDAGGRSYPLGTSRRLAGQATRTTIPGRVPSKYRASSLGR